MIMADKVTLADEYKEIMIAWGKANLDRLDKSHASGEVIDGYDDLRKAIEDKYNTTIATDSEKLLQDKYDNAVVESKNKIEYINNLLPT